jgi:phage terminase large subunit GpA-like protein
MDRGGLDLQGGDLPIPAARAAEELAEGASFPPGTIHLPDWLDDEWLKQFVAEQLVTVKTKRGFTRLEWQKLRERNEALDTRVYARAAAWIVGLDRWSEERWAEAEADLRLLPVSPALPRPEAPKPPGPSASRDGWVGRHRGWLK